MLPVQFEIMSLRSCNAEHGKRLFRQAKDIASNTSNRKPESVIPNILLRLQAKQKQTNLYSSMQASSSRISKEAEGDAQYTNKNTVITHDFIKFLVGTPIEGFTFLQGEPQWWKGIDTDYEFHGDNSSTAPRMPTITYFRDTTLQRIQNKKTMLWHKIKDDTLSLPTPFIWLYDEAGNLVGRKYYTEPSRCASNVSETTSMTCSDTVETDDTNVPEEVSR